MCYAGDVTLEFSGGGGLCVSAVLADLTRALNWESIKMFILYYLNLSKYLWVFDDWLNTRSTSKLSPGGSPDGLKINVRCDSCVYIGFQVRMVDECMKDTSVKPL